MLFCGTCHEGVLGSTSLRIVSISDRLAVGTKNTDVFVVGQVIKVDVVIKFKSVSELDPVNK